MSQRLKFLFVVLLPLLLLSCTIPLEMPDSSLFSDPTLRKPRPAEASKSSPIEQLEVYTVAAFPVRVHAVLSGHYPDTCTRLTNIQEDISGTIISLTLTFERIQQSDCSNVKTPFEEIVPLSVAGLPADTYMVEVNGLQAVFELLSDNLPPSF
jgi:hypothetical protein